MDFQKRYDTWCQASWIDAQAKAELLAIAGDPAQIEDRFYTDLEFGTAGLRGVIGAGTNRMNEYVVARATQGLAETILEADADAAKRGVVIAYDSRLYSDVFARIAAQVLCQNGIKTFLFDELRPVPELSFAIRYLKCISGIVITASHNPPEYNGYKVYWEDGGQLPPEPAAVVLQHINAIEDYGSVKRMDVEQAKAQGLLEIIGAQVDDAYIAAVKELAVAPERTAAIADDFTVIYTPLHGSGNKPVRRILKEIGVKNVHVVPSQEKPDPAFPTVVAPNPERSDVFTEAIQMAQELDADIIIGTDPDADRLGLVVKDEQDRYFPLTGNQIGVLLLHYILEAKKQKGVLPANGAVVKSLVSTPMAAAIAADYGVELFDVPTGFKFIAEKIQQFQTTGDYTFLFGFEESFGYLSGTKVRDKDAVNAAMLAVETAAYYKQRGMTLHQGLQELYEKYGYFVEKVDSYTFTGVEGMQKIRSIMEYLREHTPSSIGSFFVAAVRDYLSGVRTVPGDGSEQPLSDKAGNMLYYELSGRAFSVIRPSGTEPKIKIYYAVSGKTAQQAQQQLQDMQSGFKSILKGYID